MAPKPGVKAKNKGKGRGKGKAPQEPAAAIQGEDAGQQQPVAAGGEGEPVASHPANVEYLAKLQNAWSTVTSHPVFDSVQTRDPYEIEAGPILDDICWSNDLCIFVVNCVFYMLRGHSEELFVFACRRLVLQKSRADFKTATTKPIF